MICRKAEIWGKHHLLYHKNCTCLHERKKKPTVVFLYLTRAGTFHVGWTKCFSTLYMPISACKIISKYWFGD